MFFKSLQSLPTELICRRNASTDPITLLDEEYAQFEQRIGAYLCAGENIFVARADERWDSLIWRGSSPSRGIVKKLFIISEGGDTTFVVKGVKMKGVILSEGKFFCNGYRTVGESYGTAEFDGAIEAENAKVEYSNHPHNRDLHTAHY